METRPRRHVLLALGGDVMTGRGIDQVLPHPCPPRLHEPVVTSALDYVALAERASGAIPRPVPCEYVWGDALAELDRRRPAARIVNLETSITTSEDAEPKGINYRMHPANVGVLTAARLDCCTLANNHVLDWGEAGLLETLDSLDRAGIPHAGAGRDEAGAMAPATLDLGGGARLLVFAFGARDSGIGASWSAGAGRPGVHLLAGLGDATIAGLAALVASARRPGDLALASVHWGSNWGYGIPREHRRFAHALVDEARFDVVLGHSSHHPRAIELHAGRPILYGCGDLVNDYEGIRGDRDFRAELVLLHWVELDAGSGALVELTMTPYRIRRFRLTTSDAADRAWLLARMDRECARFGHRVVAQGGGFALR